MWEFLKKIFFVWLWDMPLWVRRRAIRRVFKRRTLWVRYAFAKNENILIVKKDRGELDSPLRRYKTCVSGGETIDGCNRSWAYNFCKLKFNGSYSKVNVYLLKISRVGIQGCSKVNPKLKEGLEKEQLKAQVNKERQRGAPLNITLPPINKSKKKIRKEWLNKLLS